MGGLSDFLNFEQQLAEKHHVFQSNFGQMNPDLSLLSDAQTHEDQNQPSLDNNQDDETHSEITKMREILRLQKKYHSDYLQYEELLVHDKYADFISKDSINANHIKVYQEIITFLEALFEKSGK